MSLKSRSFTVLLVLGAAIAGAPPVAVAQSGFGTRPTAGIFGGVTLPTGDLGDVVATGWHAGALAKFRAYRSIDARLDGTYAKFGKKADEGTTATVRTDASVGFGTLGAVLNLGADSAAYPGDNTVSPYLIGGLGIYRLAYKAVCTGTCNTQGFTFEDPKVENNFGVNIGFGATVPLMGIRTFAEGRYHRIQKSDEEGGNATMFLLSVGVKFR